MALSKSPPFIKLFASKASNSLKKTKVRQGAISVLKSSILYMDACCVPKTSLP